MRIEIEHGSSVPSTAMSVRQAFLLNSLESTLAGCLPFYKQIASITSLESALTGHSQLAENTATLTPAESALTNTPSVTSLDSALTKNAGREGTSLKQDILPTDTTSPITSHQSPITHFPLFFASKTQSPIFVFNDLHTLLQFSALFCTDPATPPLCFQSLAHSFALTTGEGVSPFRRQLATRHSALRPQPVAPRRHNRNTGSHEQEVGNGNGR
jgi:hypothetical protein